MLDAHYYDSSSMRTTDSRTAVICRFDLLTFSKYGPHHKPPRIFSGVGVEIDSHEFVHNRRRQKASERRMKVLMPEKPRR